MDWKTIGVLGALGIVFFMLFGSALLKPFEWEATDVIDKSQPGQPKYYYILVDFTVDAWKTDDGRQGGVDLKDYSVKGYVTSSIPIDIIPSSGEFQIKVVVKIDGITKLAKKYDLSLGRQHFELYFEAGIGMHTVTVEIVEYWWNYWGWQQGEKVILDQQFFVNLVRI